MLERSPQRRGNRAGAGIDFHHAAIPVVAHHHAAGVARQAAGRSRGNARAILKDALAGLIEIRQDLGVDVDHHLVALGRRAGIDAVVQRRLGEQRQRVRLLLDHGRRVDLRLLVAPSLVQRLAGRG